MSALRKSKLCVDLFWDINVTWYAEVPDFTECFQQLALGFFPCSIFCVITLPYLAYLSFHRRNTVCLPWTPLNLSKLVLCLCLILLNSVHLYYSVIDSVNEYFEEIQLYHYGMKIATFVIFTVVLMAHRLTGVKASTMLFVFWIVLSFCDTLRVRSSFLKATLQSFPSVSYRTFIMNMISCTLVYCELFLSVFMDAKDDSIKKKQSPMEEEPLFSFLTFDWMNGLIMKSRKQLLKLKDFPPLSPRLCCGVQWQKLQSKWAEDSLNRVTGASCEKDKSSVSHLLSATVRAFWPWILCATIWELIYDIFWFTLPFILDAIIQFMELRNYAWQGYFYCILLFTVIFVSRFAFNCSVFYPTVLGLQIKATYTSAIFRKSLQISCSERKKYTTGELVNLMAVDLDRIYEMFLYFPLTFGIPIRIVVSLVLLWRYLGLSCLAGIAMLLLILPLTVVIAKINHHVQVKQMEKKDERLKYMSEILNGVKLLKLLAWEEPFMKTITKIRDKEVQHIRAFLFCYAASSFVWACAPILVSGASFVVYVLIGNNILYPSIAFVSLNLMNMIKISLFEIPNLISKYIQGNVSLKRVAVLLDAENCDRNSVGFSPEPENAVSIKNASLSWGISEPPVLKDIDLHIPKGSLVAVIGLVGCGKSSLLNSLLGLMHKVSGTIDIQGKLAYVPQQPWIQNRTVRDNILFVKDMEREFYDKVLDCCCLRPDLKILPGGDVTEIGEKGVNLSGGQKQRVSLARAVYQMADVYLLDDPLSAVDSHVGKQIFDTLISHSGMLANKTRVFVTHNISFLPDVDFIVAMKDGRIEDVGTYEELIDKNGPFAEYIQKHGNAVNCTEDDIVSIESLSEKPEERKLSASLSLLSSSIRSSLNGSVKEMRQDIAGVTLVEEEMMEIGKVKRSIYISYLKHASLYIFLPAIFGYMSYQAFELGSNVWLSEWSSDPVPEGRPEDIALRNNRIIVYALLGLGQAFFVVLGTVLLAIGVARASKVYHYEMLKSVMKSPMSFFDTTPLGRILNRFGNDMDVIDTRVPLEVDGFLACLFIVIGSYIIISINIPAFLIALIPICGIYFFLQALFLTASRQMKRLESIMRSPIYSHFAESLQGASCIKAFNVENEFIKTLEAKTDACISCYFCWTCCNRWLTLRLHFVGCVIVFVTSLLAVYHRGILSASTVGLILTYAISCIDSLNWIVRTAVELENKSVSVERIEEYSKLPSEAPWYSSDGLKLNSWPSDAVITFKDYAARYREGLDMVLKNLNLHVFASEKLGIVGRTGAGKSSITLALFRIVEPANGTIFIDGIDISEIGLHDLRSKLTIIPQDPIVFTGTVRTNLDPNNVYTDEELWLSLEHAHLKKLIASLPEGLEHNISEGGENLSVGQRQLLCLARALLKKTKILVLDEATAAVDYETDSLIQETIRSDFKNSTVITIAHRINTIMDYDRVIVMEDGEIVESGDPSELLQQPDSYFHALAEHAGIV